MQTNQFLDQFKKIYFDTKSKEDLNKKWLLLEKKLHRQQAFFINLSRTWLYIILILLLLGTSTLTVFAQSAKPGEILFPIKQISSPIVTAISGKTNPTPTPQPIILKDEIKSEKQEEASESSQKKESEDRKESQNDKNEYEDIESNNESKDEFLKSENKEESEFSEQYNQELDNNEKQDNEDSREKSKKETNNNWFEWLFHNNEKSEEEEDNEEHR